MIDRQPSPGKEGRVLITPEDGSAPYFAKISMADEPLAIGDPLNKNTLLKDVTAALYGKGDTAVPDEVLSILGKAPLVGEESDTELRYCGLSGIVKAVSNGAMSVVLDAAKNAYYTTDYKTFTLITSTVVDIAYGTDGYFYLVKGNQYGYSPDGINFTYVTIPTITKTFGCVWAFGSLFILSAYSSDDTTVSYIARANLGTCNLVFSYRNPAPAPTFIAYAPSGGIMAFNKANASRRCGFI